MQHYSPVKSIYSNSTYQNTQYQESSVFPIVDALFSEFNIYSRSQYKKSFQNDIYVQPALFSFQEPDLRFLHQQGFDGYLDFLYQQEMSKIQKQICFQNQWIEYDLGEFQQQRKLYIDMDDQDDKWSFNSLKYQSSFEKERKKQVY